MWECFVDGRNPRWPSHTPGQQKAPSLTNALRKKREHAKPLMWRLLRGTSVRPAAITSKEDRKRFAFPFGAGRGCMWLAAWV